MRASASGLLVLAAVLASPLAAACTVLPPGDHQRVAATGDGALWTNVGWSFGEVVVANGSFREATRLPALGQWVVSPDGRFAAFERGESDGMCRTSNVTLELMDLRTGATRRLPTGHVGALAASPTHLALTRDESDAIELYEWESGALARAIGPVLRDWNPGYGEEWRANETTRLAFSPDGARLAAVTGTQRTLLVFEAATGNLTRPGAPSYGFPSDDELVGLAFSPDGRLLAGVTSQDHRFSEVFAWDLALPSNAVLGLRRYAEGARGLAWTDAGLVVAFEERDWPPGPVVTGILRRYPNADLSEVVEARREGAPLGPALAADRGILYAAGDAGVELLDVRTLRPLAEDELPGPDAPPAPDPEPTRDAPLPLLVTLAGILGASLASRGGTRRP